MKLEPGQFPITEALRQSAQVLASERTESHGGRRKPEHEQNNEDKQDRIEFYSSLSEVGLLDAIEYDCLMNDKPFPARFKLLTKTTTPTPDVITPLVEFDIKCLLPGYRYLCINKVRNDMPGLHWYVVVVFPMVGDIAQVLYPISSDSVRKHGELKTGHSPYYSIDTAKVKLKPYTLPLWFLVNPPEKSAKEVFVPRIQAYSSASPITSLS